MRISEYIKTFKQGGNKLNNENSELSPAFLAEIKSIIKIIIDRYHLKCTGVEDKNFTDEIIRISKKYRNPEMPLICEKTVADNLFIRRLTLGKTLDEIAATALVSPETVAEYEAGKKQITGKSCEFAKIASAYGYNSSNINKIFLYGASFHDLFHTTDSCCLRSKKELAYAPNPFFTAAEDLFLSSPALQNNCFSMILFMIKKKTGGKDYEKNFQIISCCHCSLFYHHHSTS